jgi:hypothetical protein
MVFSEKNWAFWLVYPVILTILWPFSVLFVSFFTGQFRFFKGYLSRVGAKLVGGISGVASTSASASPIHVAIFASGAGSNALKIIEYFENQYVSEFVSGTKTSRPIKVSLIVCNVPTAGVLEIAKEKGIPTLLINKTEFAAEWLCREFKKCRYRLYCIGWLLMEGSRSFGKCFSKSDCEYSPCTIAQLWRQGNVWISRS